MPGRPPLNPGGIPVIQIESYSLNCHVLPKIFLQSGRKVQTPKHHYLYYDDDVYLVDSERRVLKIYTSHKCVIKSKIKWIFITYIQFRLDYFYDRIFFLSLLQFIYFLMSKTCFAIWNASMFKKIHKTQHSLTPLSLLMLFICVHRHKKTSMYREKNRKNINMHVNA
jgi:hypothetical protein